MKMISPIRLSKFALLICVLSLASSCLRKHYDAPPDTSGDDPMLKVNYTIAELKTLPTYVLIQEDIVVQGIVVMDDKQGNYFRKIVIQDSTGGIEVLIDQSNLYVDFPVGRKIYIKCRGLYLGANGDNPQLGYTPDATGYVSGIPSLLVGNYVVKASFPNPIIPDTFTLAELKDVNTMKRHLNTLVVVKDVEFDTASVSKPYAQQAVISSSTEHRLLNCLEQYVVLKTSSYARFQPELTPAGNGYITAVYTRFFNKAQLIIRDTNDVHFTGPRCTDLVQNLFQYNFPLQTENEELNIEGWRNFAEIGGKKFYKGMIDNEPAARITAFGGGTPSVVKTWLITPSIDLTGKQNVKLSFKTKDGYDNGAKIKVLVSSNYSGTGNPNDDTWTALPSSISNGNTAGYAADWTVAYTYVPFSAPVHFAFVYEGGSNRTTTFYLTDIKVLSE